MTVILALETRYNETACTIIRDREVLASVVSSQIEVHKRYGGVVPEVASRQHVLTINPVIEETLATASIRWEAIDGIGVTCGPGLVGSLLTGVMVAKTLNSSSSSRRASVLRFSDATCVTSVNGTLECVLMEIWPVLR